MYCRWPEMPQHISCSDSPNSFWKSLCWPLCSVLVTADREFVFVQLLSCVRLSAMSLTATHQGSPSFIISQSLLRLMSIESVMPYNHLILCHPLLLLPSMFPRIRVFSSELAVCIGCPKLLERQISPSKEYSQLISFRIDCYDLLAVQETLKSPLQHRNSKAPILWRSAFFMVQLSHLCMTTEKTIALSFPGSSDREMEKVKWKWKSLSCVQLFMTPWTVQSMKFSRLEY